MAEYTVTGLLDGEIICVQEGKDPAEITYGTNSPFTFENQSGALAVDQSCNIFSVAVQADSGSA